MCGYRQLNGALRKLLDGDPPHDLRDAFVQTKAHRSRAAAIHSDEPLVHWAGNRVADRAAKSGKALCEPPDGDGEDETRHKWYVDGAVVLSAGVVVDDVKLMVDVVVEALTAPSTATVKSRKAATRTSNVCLYPAPICAIVPRRLGSLML